MTGLRGPRARLAAVAIAAMLVALTVALATATHKTAHASASAGLQTGPGRWSPGHASLGRRLAALRLPGQSDAGFHIHALLPVFINGRPVAHPAGHALRAHDRIVVGYGPPRSCPATDTTLFPPGL